MPARLLSSLDLSSFGSFSSLSFDRLWREYVKNFSFDDDSFNWGIVPRSSLFRKRTSSFCKAFVWVLVIRKFRSISWLQVWTWFSHRLARPWFFILANFAANTICLFGLIDKRYCSLCRASWRSRSCFSCLVSFPSSKQVGEIENSSVLWSRLALSLSSMLVKSSTLGL